MWHQTSGLSFYIVASEQGIEAKALPQHCLLTRIVSYLLPLTAELPSNYIASSRVASCLLATGGGWGDLLGAGARPS